MISRSVIAPPLILSPSLAQLQLFWTVPPLLPNLDLLTCSKVLSQFFYPPLAGPHETRVAGWLASA